MLILAENIIVDNIPYNDDTSYEREYIYLLTKEYPHLQEALISVSKKQTAKFMSLKYSENLIKCSNYSM